MKFNILTIPVTYYANSKYTISQKHTVVVSKHHEGNIYNQSDYK